MSVTRRLLSTTDHDRGTAGLTYVYPVISRRAGGVSIGINLNPNNACNWHCVYCQVPSLTRGVAPKIDLPLLADELRSFLHQIVHGDFMQACVPEGCRLLKDIAISGNGEPTSSRQFDRVVELIADVMGEFDLAGRIKLVLITNGSYVHRRTVLNGLDHMRTVNGEVWIKLDAATRASIQRINGVAMTPAQLQRQIRISAEHCPTWIQSCMFAWDGAPPDETEQQAYMDFIQALVRDNVPVEGVLLYGLARPSMQAEAAHVSALPEAWMLALAGRIEAAGIPVRLNM